jgi:hypothetical protein
MTDQEIAIAVRNLMNLQPWDFKAIMQLLKDKGVEPWKNLQ